MQSEQSKGGMPIKLTEMWHEACRLAERSLRLRAFLALLERQGDRPNHLPQEMTVRQLARLIADVKDEMPALPQPKSYGEALQALVDWDFIDCAKYREQQIRANREGAHKDLLAFEKVFVARFRRLGIPMFAHCVVRGQAEQDRLFVQGRSRAKFGKSAHNYGCAVDLVHGVRAWEVPRESWDIIGHVGLEVAAQMGLKMAWGGDWKGFYDPAHWELADWRSRVLHGPPVSP